MGISAFLYRFQAWGECWDFLGVTPRRKLANCLLYTSDAADDMQCVDLGGRRIIKKKKKKKFFFFFFFYFFFFFFKQKTAYEISACLVGSEMCIRDRFVVKIK